MEKEEFSWLKSKGYLHLTGQVDVRLKQNELLKKVLNPNYVAKYAFFPLIHSVIKERKYKKTGSGQRAHSFINSEGLKVKTIKMRPLHYATHMDALIFGYYASLLQEKYEEKLKQVDGLSRCIIAYRKIPIEGSSKNKSTIHFAHEIFEEIKARSIDKKGCVVFAFDIKSFFSNLDHTVLKKAWSKLIGVERLSKDHFNVFTATTKFSYILRDELRKYQRSGGRKLGFDEKELARIRKISGINAFFESPQAFREKVKLGELKIYKYPFRNKEKEPVGIPQGLPISAVLANIYLLNFDLQVFNTLVKNYGCYYRRYSDDIAIVCDTEQSEFVEKFITNAIELSRLSISKDKTEKFYFKTNDKSELLCTKKSGDGDLVAASFIYLGFEFNGKNILIKSANLSKFYRRMILAVKRKSKRAIDIANQIPSSKPAIYRRQLYKLYSDLDLNKTKVLTRWKKLVKTKYGTYKIISGKKTKLLRSNYFGYAKRASEIMKEPAINKQVRNHKKIFNQAINKHLKVK